jgi:hypothetical protein
MFSTYFLPSMAVGFRSLGADHAHHALLDA